MRACPEPPCPFTCSRCCYLGRGCRSLGRARSSWALGPCPACPAPAQAHTSRGCRCRCRAALLCSTQPPCSCRLVCCTCFIASSHVTLICIPKLPCQRHGHNLQACVCSCHQQSFRVYQAERLYVWKDTPNASYHKRRQCIEGHGFLQLAQQMQAQGQQGPRPGQKTGSMPILPTGDGKASAGMTPMQAQTLQSPPR